MMDITERKEWISQYGISVLKSVTHEIRNVPSEYGRKAAETVLRFHRQLAAYGETELISLDGLAEKYGVGKILIKDESGRFGLKAFKGLGGSYAMFCILCGICGLDPDISSLADLHAKENREKIQDTVFVTATDGNHGKGVSWAGGLFGCKVHVFMPKGTVEARAEAIRKAGPADVLITEVNYDETVSYARRMAEENGWYLIQDTAWDGYEKVPEWIMQGYLTMALEASEQMDAIQTKPSHIFLQAGVGAMAGALAAFFSDIYQDSRPEIAIVEPDTVNCVYLSAKTEDGSICPVTGDPVTIMAGLNCGTPCKTAWPLLRDYADWYIACPDYAAAHGMRVYASGTGGDRAVISGESGASTMGALSLLLTRPELSEVRNQMGISDDSVILLINTEGATDPEGYRNVVENNAYPLP